MFSSGLLPHWYRNIISIVAFDNCCTESPYIYSEGASEGAATIYL